MTIHLKTGDRQVCKIGKLADEDAIPKTKYSELDTKTRKKICFNCTRRR